MNLKYYKLLCLGLLLIGGCKTELSGNTTACSPFVPCTTGAGAGGGWLPLRPGHCPEPRRAAGPPGSPAAVRRDRSGPGTGRSQAGERTVGL
ncbi:hypothetical protein EBR78_03600, partial [bacterium]|nr:hypothetical protein [bacterium]